MRQIRRLPLDGNARMNHANDNSTNKHMYARRHNNTVLLPRSWCGHGNDARGGSAHPGAHDGAYGGAHDGAYGGAYYGARGGGRGNRHDDDDVDESVFANYLPRCQHNQYACNRWHDEDIDDLIVKPKFTMPSFKGTTEVEVYLAWEQKVDKLFCMNLYSDQRKLDLVVTVLDGYVVTWWEHCVQQRMEKHEPRVFTWDELK